MGTLFWQYVGALSFAYQTTNQLIQNKWFLHLNCSYNNIAKGIPLHDKMTIKVRFSHVEPNYYLGIEDGECRFPCHVQGCWCYEWWVGACQISTSVGTIHQNHADVVGMSSGGALHHGEIPLYIRRRIQLVSCVPLSTFQKVHVQ